MADITITPAGAAFNPTDTVTSTRLNEARNPTAALVAASISTADIADAAVTKDKIENISAPLKVLGRTTAGAGVAEEVTINDENDMANASAITLATDESIKAYVDEYAMKYSGATGTIDATASYVDWDLSSVVGTNRAMVVLELWNASSGASIMLRPNGSVFTERVTNSNAGYGASGLVCDTGNIGGTAAVVTDESGIIEITKAGSGTETVNYKIQAYQKLA